MESGKQYSLYLIGYLYKSDPAGDVRRGGWVALLVEILSFNHRRGFHHPSILLVGYGSVDFLFCALMISILK